MNDSTILYFRHMIQEIREMVGSERPRVSIIDPQRFVFRPENEESIIENENALVEHISKILSHYKDERDFYALPYNPTWHWILIVIVPKLGEVWYLDSANTGVENLTFIKSVITRYTLTHILIVLFPLIVIREIYHSFSIETSVGHLICTLGTSGSPRKGNFIIILILRYVPK